MVLCCGVCKIYQVKGDTERSFHNLPKSEQRKNQWLTALGLPKTTQSAVACSDHFLSTDFSTMQQPGQIIRRRLGGHAIPSQNLINNKENITQNIYVEREVVKDVVETANYCNQQKQDIHTSALNTLAYQTNRACSSNNRASNHNIQRMEESQYQKLQVSKSSCEMDSDGRKVAQKRKSCSDNNSIPAKKVCIETGSGMRRALSQKQYRVQLGLGFETFSERDFTSNEKWNSFQNFVQYTRKRIKVVKQGRSRMKRKVTNLKELMRILKKKNFLNRKAEDQVKGSLSPGAKLLIDGVLKGKKYSEFPVDLRAFALSLHFYAPNAYDFVRKSFMNILPHPSTLREWLKSVNYNPGISSEALDTVDKMVIDAAAKKETLYFNLVADEMSVRKHIRWNPNEKKFDGTIDLGRSSNGNYDNAEPASNALVFMLVCINKHFKIPIAYYFINALAAVEKKILLTDILHECYLHKIDVRNVTFDGASSNIGMVEELGANIYDNMSAAYFQHPDDTNKKVYASLDGCHMHKLARNTVASSDIVDGDGDVISWKYIQRLVDFQEKEGLHLATKIRRRHVNFSNEKMKVSLAAQTLSKSVAVALEVCEVDLEIPEFDGAAATAKYSRIMDDCFDILNSKNRLCKNPSKQAITKDNLEDMKTRVAANSKYIQSLKIDGVPICKSSKRTAFIGLITSMNNVVQLADDLFKEGHLKFLCTYKLSQDHLETFFSCIRRCGGFNNNPNALQFKSAYCKLIAHASISVPLSANCTPLDGTNILMTLNNSKLKLPELPEFTVESLHINDLLKLLSEIKLSEYVNEVISYVSGSIVKMIKDKIKCGLCLGSLEACSKKEPMSVLQRRKAYGTLTSPSKDVIVICENVERVLRAESSLMKKNIKEKLIIQTIRVLPMHSIFSKHDHSFETDPMSDHRTSLTKLILNKFFDTRLHYAATSMLNIQVRIRQKNNNLTKFQGQ